VFFKQTAETNPCRDVASAAVAIEVWRSADANSAEGLGRLGGKTWFSVYRALYDDAARQGYGLFFGLAANQEYPSPIVQDAANLPFPLALVLFYNIYSRDPPSPRPDRTCSCQ